METVVLDHMSNSKRAEQRESCDIGAYVTFAENGPRFPCIIDNISIIGAKIRIDTDVKLPIAFSLLIPILEDVFETRHCSLIWRVECVAGVEFSS